MVYNVQFLLWMFDCVGPRCRIRFADATDFPAIRDEKYDQYQGSTFGHWVFSLVHKIVNNTVY